ncbi:MAG TPA: DUF6220 domain-containing protein [Asanoa sp.]
MRRVYVVVQALLVAALVVQFYLAAVGAFDRPHTDDSFALHSENGMLVIPALIVLATLAAALARAPGRLIALTIAPLGLLVVQVLIIVLGNAVAGGDQDPTGPAALAILGLHAVNGMLMIGAAATVLRRARSLPAKTDRVDRAPTPVA